MATVEVESKIQPQASPFGTIATMPISFVLIPSRRRLPKPLPLQSVAARIHCIATDRDEVATAIAGKPGFHYLELTRGYHLIVAHCDEATRDQVLAEILPERKPTAA